MKRTAVAPPTPLPNLAVRSNPPTHALALKVPAVRIRRVQVPGHLMLVPDHPVPIPVVDPDLTHHSTQPLNPACPGLHKSVFAFLHLINTTIAATLRQCFPHYHLCDVFLLFSFTLKAGSQYDAKSCVA